MIWVHAKSHHVSEVNSCNQNVIVCYTANDQICRISIVILNSIVCPYRFIIFTVWWHMTTMAHITGPPWWSVNIGPGKGLVPPGNKPLPELMLAQIFIAI